MLAKLYDLICDELIGCQKVPIMERISICYFICHKIVSGTMAQKMFVGVQWRI